MTLVRSLRIAPIQRGKSWGTGSCLHKLSDRSYLVGKVCSTTTKLRAQEPFHVPEQTNLESTERAITCETRAPPLTRFMAGAPAFRSSPGTIKRPVRF